MTLRVAGEAEVPPCDDASCVLCGGGSDARSIRTAATTVHGEPLELARLLAAECGVAIPALAEPLGHEAPVGRRYGVEELGRAVDGLTAAIDVGDPRTDHEEREMQRQELRRALAVFRAGRAHHRPIVLEV